MIVYTSYFSHPEIKKNRKSFFVISIARFNPRFMKTDMTLPIAAPTKELLSQYRETDMTYTQFKAQYKKGIVSALAENSIVNTITEAIRRADGKMIVVCCYEPDVKDCHRAVFMKTYQNKITGVSLKEFNPEEVNQ